MSANKLVTCPYDEVHKCKESRLQMHITKCRLNHLDKPTFACPFNATHVYPQQEKNYHIQNCPDRAPLFRSLTQKSIDQNNPFFQGGGRTAVPEYSQPISPDDDGEVWDDGDDVQPTFSYDSNYENVKVPTGAIIEPRFLSKPAERKVLYQNLFQQDQEVPNSDNRSSKSTPEPPILRQPKQQSETSRLAHSQAQSFASVGLGRGRGQPSSRIAANIFPSQPQSSYGSGGTSYSSIVHGMQNLGVGRGMPIGAGGPVLVDDEDEFPALGFGRGVNRNPKTNVKRPGLD